jgi:hypothetical protein
MVRLDRVALVCLGLVTSNGTTFRATPLLGTLRADVAGSLHSLAIAWSAPGHWLPWGRFVDSVRTGEAQARSSRKAALGSMPSMVEICSAVAGPFAR